MGKVLIIGSHPVRDNLVGQFRRLGREVMIAESAGCVEHEDFDELAVLTSPDVSDKFREDGRAFELLRTLAGRMSEPRAKRPVVHLLLQSETSLRLLVSMDLPTEINDAFEVYPFTMEDTWAKNLFVNLPAVDGPCYPPLDREPITAASSKFVHLVILGFDAQARAVATNAALVAHYPNYDGSDRTPLRTRITVVGSDIANARDEFIAVHQSLFDHSFYRTVCPDGRHAELHRPMYYGQRADFVDVEWEFVDAMPVNAVVRRKLAQWACDKNRLLTIVISGGGDETDMATSLSLPSEIYEQGIPIFIKQSNAFAAGNVKLSARYRNLHPFGMRDCGYDVSLPLADMAKLLKYFYDCSYDERGVPTKLPLDEVEKAWQAEHSAVMRNSNLYNVMTIPTKMRSLGRDISDAGTYYALTRDEIGLLAVTEHNRWSVERLIAGIRPCTDAERAEIGRNIAEIAAARKAGRPLPADLKSVYKRERDVHYDLCAYDELGVDATGKSVRTYDYDLTACIPLILKTYLDKRRNG